jgi:hypothetical protein
MIEQKVARVGTAANIVTVFICFSAAVSTAAATTEEIQETFVSFLLFE